MELTTRQSELLSLTARGYTAKASAEELGISRRTVEASLAEAKKRLGSKTLTQAAVVWTLLAKNQQLLDTVSSSEIKYSSLDPAFLAAMDDVGRHGEEKSGEKSFQRRIARGEELTRNFPRIQTAEIIDHAVNHLREYEIGILHDHFETKTHQLAAAAFNAMLEYIYARAERSL